MNDDLNKMVIDRTSIIDYQKRQIESFAFMNAHEIRGPVSSILGIVNIIKEENLLKESELIEKHLEKTAHNLNEVIQKVQRQLNQEEWRKIEIPKKKTGN